MTGEPWRGRDRIRFRLYRRWPRMGAWSLLGRVRWLQFDLVWPLTGAFWWQIVRERAVRRILRDS